MHHIDLCSGIGGFALGFEWAGLSRPVLFCDIEPWSRKVLAKHWPDVPITDDVKELANDPDRFIPRTDPRKTILTCGYPCQPFSVAGKQRGTEDDRHIWPEIFKIIQAKRPAWICCENVTGHISLGLNQVLSDLEDKAGYAVQTFCIGAVSVNAPHRRQRIWIIAHTDSQGESDDSRFVKEGKRLVGNSEHDGSSAATVSEKHDETSKWSKEGQNETQQFKGTSKSRNCQFAPDFYVADTDSQRGCGWASWNENAEDAGQSPRGQEHRGWNTEPAVGRMADGLPTRMDGFDGWEREPADIPRVATGIKQRAARLKGLGNAIVPAIAMNIGLTIKAMIDE